MSVEAIVNILCIRGQCGEVKLVQEVIAGIYVSVRGHILDVMYQWSQWGCYVSFGGQNGDVM